MSIITKEKNMLTIIGETTGRTYHFDINTGILYGCSGKALSSRPPEVKKISNLGESIIFRTYSRLMSDYSPLEISQSERNKIALSFSDTLSSIGYTAGDITMNDIFLFTRAISSKEATLKEILQFFKEEKEQNKRFYYSVFIRNKTIKKITESLPHYNITEKELNIMEYCLQQKIDINLSLLYKYVKDLSMVFDNPGEIVRKILEYQKMCKDLNWKLEKGNFFPAYIKTKQTWELNRIKIEEEKLIKNQSKKLFFEDDEFTVVIPMSKEEFQKEAENQRNCVFWLYFPKVIDGETNIVFIREKKAIEESLITCEVRNGKIQQYLGKFNSRGLLTQSALDFEKKYQEYLNSVYKG